MLRPPGDFFQLSWVERRQHVFGQKLDSIAVCIFPIAPPHVSALKESLGIHTLPFSILFVQRGV